MNRHVYWHTHKGHDTDAQFTAHSIAQLVNHLRRELPELNLTASVLPTNVADQIDWQLDCGFLQGAISVIEKQSNADLRAGLTIYCPDSKSTAVTTARQRLPHAFWGINFRGVLSLSYARNNPYALWHESLHLLGAQDHYSSQNFQSTCAMPCCIMQFAPDERTVGSESFLCRATMQILRKNCT